MSWLFYSSEAPDDEAAKAKARNEEIDKQLRRDRVSAKSETKMLLVGPSGSGKSTILNQMKLVHHGSYTDTEKDAHKATIFKIMIQSMRDILEVLPKLNHTVQPHNEPHQALILDAVPQQSAPRRHSRTLNSSNNSSSSSSPSCEWESDLYLEDGFPPELTNALQQLWRDPAVQSALKRAPELCATSEWNDSAVYFLDAIGRIAEEGEPSDQDVVRACMRTPGGRIKETTFGPPGAQYRLIDLDSQQQHLRKWLHFFDDIGVLVFVVSLADYNRWDESDASGRTNRLHEAIALFDIICNSEQFAETEVLLLFNKADLLTESLAHTPLSVCFPEYTGEPSDVDAACDYICSGFITHNRSGTTRSLCVHYICAVDVSPGQMDALLNVFTRAVENSRVQAHLNAFRRSVPSLCGGGL